MVTSSGGARHGHRRRRGKDSTDLPAREPQGYPLRMETTPAIQDYLGAIYDLAGSDQPVIGARLARHMHVSAPSITEALRRMQREGYVKVAGKKEIRLTTRGLDIAKTMARRHRLLERWLTDVLGLDWSRAHDEAHRLEHALSPVVEERLAEMLGMPSTCPHGNPIPGMPQPEAHNPIPLSQATKGASLVVERITEEAEADRQLLHFLWESGVRPGIKLTVTEVAPYAGTISVLLNEKTVTMGFAAAHKIWVYDPQQLSPPRRAGTRSSQSHRLDGRQGAVRAPERLHGLREIGPLLRRALGGKGPDPRLLLPGAHRRHHHPLRYGPLPARGARPPAQRSPREVQRGGSARAPARRDRPRAGRRGRGGALASPLRSRRRGLPLPGLGDRRPAGRVCVRALSRWLLRDVLLQEELRPAGAALAPSRRRRGDRARGDRAAKRRPHARASVAPRGAAGVGPGDPGRRLLLLAGVDRQRDSSRRGVGSHAGHALDPALEDHRPSHGRARVPEPRPGVLGFGHSGPGRVSLTTSHPALSPEGRGMIGPLPRWGRDDVSPSPPLGERAG